VSVDPLVVTVRDAATMLSISRSQIYVLIAKGDLATYRIGRSRRVAIRSIHRLLADAADVPRVRSGRRMRRGPMRTARPIALKG
jgi:excisionase family DNA binding protein